MAMLMCMLCARYSGGAKAQTVNKGPASRMRPVPVTADRCPGSE